MGHGANDETWLRERLRQVYWLGGSACSGKTAVARRLAAAHGLAVYHTDDSFERHRRQADPRRYPAFCRVGDLAVEALLAAPADEQASEMLAFHREHLELVIADLAAAPPDQPLLVEGTCLLPARVAQLAAGPARTLWLLATPRFRRRSYRRRGPWVERMLAACDQPAAAFERWMARDDALADWRRQQLAALGLAWRDVDGRRPPAEEAAAVAAHFQLAVPAGVG